MPSSLSSDARNDRQALKDLVQTLQQEIEDLTEDLNESEDAYDRLKAKYSRLKDRYQNLKHKIHDSQPIKTEPKTDSDLDPKSLKNLTLNEADSQATSRAASRIDSPKAQPIKMPHPEQFNGDRDRFDEWKSQVQNYIFFQGSMLQTDESRIRYVTTRLTGPAFNLVKPRLSPVSPHPIQTFHTLMQELEDVYGDHHYNRVARARTRMFNLEQGANQSFDEFYAEFSALAAQIPNHYLDADSLKRKLNYETHRLLPADHPEDLTSFVKTCRNADLMLQTLQEHPEFHGWEDNMDPHDPEDTDLDENLDDDWLEKDSKMLGTNENA